MKRVSDLWVVLFELHGRERSEYLACDEIEIVDLARKTLPGRVGAKIQKIERISLVHIAESVESL